MARIELFFDCASPWTYLAFHRIQPLAEEAGTEIAWRPILVGGVFNAVNPGVYAERANPVPAKARYFRKDLQDWARYCGLRLRWPEVFPLRSVKVMRGCLVAQDEGALPAFARAAFEAYWGEGEDLDREAVVARVAERAGLDGAALLARIEEPETKRRLRANTDELVARGGFGSPTIFVDGDDLYFGNDRLPLVRAALRKEAADHV